MKLNFDRIQKDLQEGIKTVLQTSGEWSRNMTQSSGKLGVRLRVNRLENQLEDCFREIGKRVHLLRVSQGEGDFSGDPEVNRLVQEASNLMSERDKLFQGTHQREKEEPVSEDHYPKDDQTGQA